jgi:branched-chain amino acid aminotransferase
MDLPQFVWIDGELIPTPEAVVPVWTHALHYGTGVFEGIRCYETDDGGAIFRLREHLERLRRSAELINLPMPMALDELVDGCLAAVRSNELTECYVRPLVFAGHTSLGVHAENPARALVIAWAWPSYLGSKEGIRATLSSWQRVGPNVIPHAAKATGLYLNAALPGRDARRAGYDEAILLASDGTVADATAQNVFVVRDGVVKTPPLSTGILPGITRATIMTLLAEMELEVVEEPLIRSDLQLADEIFLTSTAAEIVRVAELDGRRFPSDRLSAAVAQRYGEVVRGRVAAHRNWLTPISSSHATRSDARDAA